MTQPNDPSSNLPPSAVPPPTGPVDPMGGPPDDSRTMAMLAHMLNVTLLGPLIIYIAKKGTNAFLDSQAKEALNFSICCLIVHILCGVVHLFCIPALVSAALSVAQIVLGIIGGLKARDGIPYKYPINFALIK